jgi:hypothetical protein
MIYIKVMAFTSLIVSLAMLAVWLIDEYLL